MSATEPESKDLRGSACAPVKQKRIVAKGRRARLGAERLFSAAAVTG
jgi:hypothetical protein